MGDTVVPAEAPDWPRVHAMCSDILTRTKDLRIAQLLLRAWVHTRSLTGLHAGVQLLRGLFEEYWDSVYPALDPDDDNDPTERMTVLASLADPDEMLAELRDAPVVRSPVFGTLSLRDLQLAAGRVEPRTDEQPLDAATVSAAFKDCDLEQLRADTQAVCEARNEIESLAKFLEGRVEPADIPNLAPFTAMLDELETELKPRLGERESSGENAESAEAPGDARPEAAAQTRAPTDPTRIASREDVVRMLDSLCAYYRSNEPSSPVPLLLMRARRLATKDFVDIMQDLVPEAMDKIAAIRGPEDKEK